MTCKVIDKIYERWNKVFASMVRINLVVVCDTNPYWNQLYFCWKRNIISCVCNKQVIHHVTGYKVFINTYHSAVKYLMNKHILLMARLHDGCYCCKISISLSLIIPKGQSSRKLSLMFEQPW